LFLQSAQQIIERAGETACFIKTYFVKPEVARSGFARVNPIVRLLYNSERNKE